MPDGIQHAGRILMVSGIVIALIGALFFFSGRFSWFGRLPGDILVQKKNLTFYFPLATSLLISLLLTIIFWLLGRR
jgi:hypothetical protein